MAKACGKDLLIQIVTETIPDAWVTSTAYLIGDYVLHGGNNYVALTNHTSGVFATDLADDDWALGDPPDTLTTILGGQSNSATINSEAVDVTDKQSARWRELLNCGIRSMDLSFSGVATDDATQEFVLENMQNGTIHAFRLISGLGRIWQGNFQIRNFEIGGEHNAAETVSFSLESSGSIAYTAPA